jgi:hypothetical protein
MKQVLSMEEEGIDLTEKISNTEFYIYDHWRYGKMSPEVVGGSAGSDFFKKNYSIFSYFPVSNFSQYSVEVRLCKTFPSTLL